MTVPLRAKTDGVAPLPQRRRACLWQPPPLVPPSSGTDALLGAVPPAVRLAIPKVPKRVWSVLCARDPITPPSPWMRTDGVLGVVPEDPGNWEVEGGFPRWVLKMKVLRMPSGYWLLLEY